MEKTKIKELIGQMTLEEKASMCAGKDFWHTMNIDRLGIPMTMLTDGPHGLRKQVDAVDHLGISESNKAICFPAGCALASGYDEELSYAMGEELGKIAYAEDVTVDLGPAMNIKRSPLCGRNFEYYSEDPLVSSTVATGTIKGIQSQNVGACPKHFLANNQEYYRMTSNSVVDERTMREIYLRSFEKAVKNGKPWTIMCSYNQINGTYASENKLYLTDILRGEWGFDGYVMTDWGACDDPVESIKAGLDLSMPGPGIGNIEHIINAVKDGSLEEAVVDQAVERMLNITFRYSEAHTQKKEYDYETGHETARRIAEESAVLLKNEDAVLPLSEQEKVVVIGEYAKVPRYQGGGSSHINPYKVTGAWEIIGNYANVLYVEGYKGLDANASLMQEAVEAAKKADKAVIFAGLPDEIESEGFDRKNLDMPANQNALIAAVAAVQPNTVVVLHNGSPITMPWLEDVKAVLELYLGGEAVGAATANLLYGKANPCGHLAETFPMCIEDTPTYPYYGVEKGDVIYREETLVGYRFYNTMNRKVLFPFGHGLSYTTFTYSDLTVDKNEMMDTDTLNVSVTVKNTGNLAGKALVQLYVGAETPHMIRAKRELQGFQKVSLLPGESRTVTISLDKEAFAYWNVDIHDWYVATGTYKIQVGTSAADIVLEKDVTVTTTSVLRPQFTVNSPMGDMMENPIAQQVLGQMMGQMMGQGAQHSEELEDTGVMNKEATSAMAQAMPMRSLVSFSPDARIEQMQQMVDGINQAIQNS